MFGILKNFFTKLFEWAFPYARFSCDCGNRIDMALMCSAGHTHHLVGSIAISTIFREHISPQHTVSAKYRTFCDGVDHE